MKRTLLTVVITVIVTLSVVWAGNYGYKFWSGPPEDAKYKLEYITESGEIGNVWYASAVRPNNTKSEYIKYTPVGTTHVASIPKRNIRVTNLDLDKGNKIYGK